MTKFNINDSATFQNGTKFIYISCETEDEAQVSDIKTFISAAIAIFQKHYVKEADENKG